MSVGGCETGPIGFDPDDPTLIYAGCYGGYISRYNTDTEESRNVMVYPQLQLGQAPKNLRERFQWVSPIVVSPHNPEVVYHASHRIWRSTDQGLSWEKISPDLTTNTKKHQEFGGRPITNEGTGVEVYNTVFSLRVSPHSPQTLWAGTDDGRAWLSRNNGENWQEITPGNMPVQGTVNRIEVSPHQAGKAYLAVYRYRMDDWHPYIFRTTDFGNSWKLLTTGENGIPADSPTRVVREDSEREGLLYAGTEFGMYVSFDDGRHWQSFQQNLPVSPVTDLKVHRNDLVVATQGRSFWIMDDLTPLHQLSDEIATAERYLFEPRKAYHVNISSGQHEYAPEGRSEGALIRYYFADSAGKEVQLKIKNEKGEVVRTFSSDSAKAEEAGEPRLPAEEGMNEFNWNLKTRKVDKPDSAVIWGYTGGVKVLPGKYRTHLEVGEESQARMFEVRTDPRIEDVTREDLKAQYQLATSIKDTLDRIYDAVRTIQSLRDQLQSVAQHAKKAGYNGKLTERADSIAGELTSVEEELLQIQAESGQDIINYPPQLDNQYAYLLGNVVSATGRPTEGSYTRFKDLNDRWNSLREQLQSIIETGVADFNEATQKAGAQPVMVPDMAPQ